MQTLNTINKANTLTENKLMVARRERGGGLGEKGEGETNAGPGVPAADGPAA